MKIVYENLKINQQYCNKKWGNKKMKVELKYISILYGIISILMLALYCFRWEFSENVLFSFIGIFLVGIYVVIFTFFIIGFVICIVFKQEKFSFLPLMISIVTMLLLVFGPLTEIYIGIKYISNKEQMKWIGDSILKENINEGIQFYKLSEEDEYLSSSGEIVVTNESGTKKFLFYTFRGVTDNFAGFIYVPGEDGICNGDFYINFDSEYTDVIKFNKNWFWVTTT